jgi:hypothetical protein
MIIEYSASSRRLTSPSKSAPNKKRASKMLQRRHTLPEEHFEPKIESIANTSPCKLNNDSQTAIAPLSKKSMRAFQITLQKNKHEKKRYVELSGKLEKSYNQEDTVWLQRFIDARNSLNEITQSSNAYETNPNICSEFENHSSLSFISTCSSHTSDRYVTSTKTPDADGTLRRGRTFTAGSSRTRNSKSAKVRFDERALNKEIEQVMSNNARSKDAFNSNSTELNSPFPFELPRSYTSMVNERYDKDSGRISSFFARTDMNSRCGRIKTASSMSTRSTPCQKQETSLKDLRSSRGFRYNPNSEFKPVHVDFTEMLLENKSIRRPLRKIVAMNDPANKARVVQERVKSFRVQNFLSYQRVDRSIRYGAPFVPKKEKPFVYLI